MRFVVYKQIWHDFAVLHRHLLLMMDFDCLLAFCHKKGEYIRVFVLVLVFVFMGRVYFCWLELVVLFRLYLSALLCSFFFSSCHMFFVLLGIHVRGSLFCVSCFKLLIDL